MGVSSGHRQPCSAGGHRTSAATGRTGKQGARGFWGSCDSVSSVGHIRILKDEAHSAGNVHLRQHNHVSATEGNTEHGDIRSKGHAALSGLFPRGRTPRDASAVQQSRHLSETPSKQPPLEGATRFTKPDVPPTRGLRRTRAADEALSGGTGRLP